MCAIFGCDFAVVHGQDAAVGSPGAFRVGPRPFVSCTLAVACCAVARGSVAVTGRVVTGFGLLVTQPGRNVTISRGQPGLAATHSSQLVGPGILAVPRRLRTIVCRHLAVVDGTLAAVGGVGAPRVGPRAFVRGAPAVARRPISRDSVEARGRVVAGFGVPITLLGGEVTRPRGQARIFAVLRGLGAILGRKPAVIDGLGAVIGGLGAPQGSLSTFVGGAPSIARRAIAFGAVEVARRVVTRFRLSVTQPGRDVAVLGSHPRLAAAHVGQLVGSGICAVFGRLGAVFGRHLAVVDGLGAVICSAGPPRGGLVAFICRMPAVCRRTVASGSVKVARRVITRFGLPITQPRRDIAILRSQAGLPTAHARQLVGPGILAILGRLGAIFGRHLSVIDRLGAVLRSFSSDRWRSGAVACRLLALTRGVVARRGLTVALLGLSIAHVRGPIAVASFYVTLAGGCQGILVVVGQSPSALGRCHNKCSKIWGPPPAA